LVTPGQNNARGGYLVAVRAEGAPGPRSLGRIRARPPSQTALITRSSRVGVSTYKTAALPTELHRRVTRCIVAHADAHARRLIFRGRQPARRGARPLGRGLASGPGPRVGQAGSEDADPGGPTEFRRWWIGGGNQHDAAKCAGRVRAGSGQLLLWPGVCG